MGLIEIIPNPKSKIQNLKSVTRIWQKAGVRLDAVARSRASLFSVYQYINRAFAWFRLIFLDLF
jgi:hypothetical protein